MEELGQDGELGRFPIGIDENNKDWFSWSERTGGDWNHYHSTGNHTLTVGEIPDHSHEIPDRYIAWDFGGNRN